MPKLDVSFVVNDPMLSDVFSVNRRTDAIDAKGRTTPTVVQSFYNLSGVFTQQDPADIMRQEDLQNAPLRILVCTNFLLRSASAGYQPDQVIWNGITFTVISVLNYSRFGGGTIEAVCLSENAVD